METIDRRQKPEHPPTRLGAGGITHVGLRVSSVEAAGQFYREILGLAGEPRVPGILYVPSAKDRLVLYEAGKGETDVHFGFAVDSPSKVDEWSAWLTQHGVPISEDVTEATYRSIKFQDPDGHWIEISYEE